MSVKTRIAIERDILSHLVTEAIKQGYSLAVDYGDGPEEKPSQDHSAIMDQLMACDEETLLFYRDGKKAGAFLVYGNDGWDVICDYNVSLDPVMKVIENYIEETYAP